MDLTDNSPSNFCDCGNKKSYSKGYDAYYCEKCNTWLEDICTDRFCEFCKRRPLTPNDTTNLQQP